MVRYLLGAADVGPFFAYQSEPSTVLVWTDGDWSGNAMTCKSTSAGAIQLGSHTIETWSVNQQVVSLSSAEREFHAIGSGCARGLTIKHVLLEILHTTTPDAEIGMTVCTDSDAATRHDSQSWVRSRETLADTIPLASASSARRTFRRGSLWHERENPSDLGTKGLEKKEATTRRVDKLAIVPATTLRGERSLQFWHKASCANKQMASIVDGCCTRQAQENHGCDGCANDQCGGRRSYHCNDTALACGHEQMRRVGSADAFQRRSAGAPQKTMRRCASDRLACTQCEQRSSPRVIGQRLARRARETLRAETNVGWFASEFGVDRPSRLRSSAKSMRCSRRGGVQRCMGLVAKPSGGNS